MVFNTLIYFTKVQYQSVKMISKQKKKYMIKREIQKKIQFYSKNRIFVPAINQGN